MRSLRFLLAVIFVAGQLGGAVHNLLVSHAICLEHGEVIHASAAPAEASPKGGISARAERSHDHDVCLIALHRRDRMAQSAPQAAIAPAHGQHRPLLALAEREPPADPLFRLAPKTSPPA